ncbi:cytochrome P450 [Benzoatithermus flavus]|uniref:Cytochrome P450 n=1 Tax=Benzoatithermus flavus TaxID=3108223 RepID=A0ABU8XWF9_9PROT
MSAAIATAPLEAATPPWTGLAAALAREPVVPPAPKPATEVLPLWRLVLQLRRNVISTWGEPAYELEILSRPFLGNESFLLNHPDAIRRVLVDNHAHYGRTPATIRILHPIFGDGLLLAEGAAWKLQRRTTAPAFAPRSLDVATRHMASVAEETVAELAAHGTSAVDLLGVMRRLTLEVAGRSFFSQAMHEHGAAIRAAMGRYSARVARPSFLDFLLPASAPSPVDVARHWLARDFHRALDRMIAERRRSPPADQPRDLFDVLVAARDPETGKGFDPEELHDQIATLIVAGHETTALALFWACYLMGLAPEVQELVAEEARSVDLSPEAAASAKERLPLARAVIQEALRLYPPAFSIVRLALDRDEILGHAIPKGSLVVVAPWILHRHRKRWGHPERFDPTRFLPGAPPVDRYAYLPFGVGPRVCIGAQFALIEATLVLARLLASFRLELVGPRRVTPVAVVTTVPDRAPIFRLLPRS